MLTSASNGKLHVIYGDIMRVDSNEIVERAKKIFSEKGIEIDNNRF